MRGSNNRVPWLAERSEAITFIHQSKVHSDFEDTGFSEARDTPSNSIREIRSYSSYSCSPGSWRGKGRHGVAKTTKIWHGAQENGRIWQNGTEWNSWNQVQIVHYAAGKGVTKNDRQNHPKKTPPSPWQMNEKPIASMDRCRYYTNH